MAVFRVVTVTTVVLLNECNSSRRSQPLQKRIEPDLANLVKRQFFTNHSELPPRSNSLV